MNITDLFVGLVAITFGTIVLIGGGGNRAWWYDLRKPRWLANRLGKTTARIIFTLVGLTLITAGLIVGLGYRIHW